MKHLILLLTVVLFSCSEKKKEFNLITSYIDKYHPNYSSCEFCEFFVNGFPLRILARQNLIHIYNNNETMFVSGNPEWYEKKNLISAINIIYAEKMYKGFNELQKILFKSYADYRPPLV